MDIKDIKQRFFALRNGIVADTLRKGGIPHKMIFGLQLPQISEIAREAGASPGLARQLWNDADVRESRLLAPYIFPAEELSRQEALEMASSLRSREEADILAWKLLSRSPFAAEIADEIEADSSHPFPYLAIALRRNLQQ